MTVKVFTRFNGPVFSRDLLLSFAACKIENSRMNLLGHKMFEEMLLEQMLLRKMVVRSIVVKINFC